MGRARTGVTGRSTLIPSKPGGRPPSTSSLEGVGRLGDLTLSFSFCNDRTVLDTVHCTSPWHYVPPIGLDDDRALLAWLVNPSGGLVGGDAVSCAVELKDNAHVIMSSLSATRVYRSLSHSASQHVSLRLGRGSVLEWMPELTIPFAGSRFAQRLEATLDPGAMLVVWDAMAAGRIARGERWAFMEYVSDLCVQVASGARLIDRGAARPVLWNTTSNVMGEWNYSASLYVVGDAIEEATWDQLNAALQACVRAREGDGVLAGVSRSAAPGIVVKVLAKSCPALNSLHEGLWQAVRGVCWGRPVPHLRRY